MRVGSSRFPALVIFAVITVTATITALAAVGIANHAGWHKVLRGKRAEKVVALSGEREVFVLDDAWANIPGAKTEIRVPAGERALITTRFTAETVCYGLTIENCSLRVKIDDRQALQAAGRNFHVDSNYGGESEESQKGHALDRSLEVGPGLYTVKVQGIAMGATNFRVDDWSLIVKRVGT
jgi:hypothetical protein